MKCVAWVVYATNIKANPKYRRRKPIGWWPVDDPAWVNTIRLQHTSMLVEDAVKCDGNIVASISAVDEPQWGGSYPELKIEYRCDRCGSNQDWYVDGPHKLLPRNDDELSKFVTRAIGDMT